jgi:periplasmic protein TonB
MFEDVSNVPVGFSLEEGLPMPQEFLRDVLRTGDAANRRQRRMSVLPISIAGHAIMVALFMFSPWGPDVELPMIAPPLQAHYLPTVPPPPAPPPPSTPAPPRNTAAPTVAPTGIADEPEIEAPPENTAPGGVPHGPGVNSSQPLLGDLGGAHVVVAPPPPPAPAPKLVRVGGVIREPRKVLHVPPIYPEFARQTRVEGLVTLEAILDATGRVESVKVLSAQPLLEDAAVRAVKQWRYTPTELNGIPVPVLMTITIRFSLER